MHSDLLRSLALAGVLAVGAALGGCSVSRAPLTDPDPEGRREAWVKQQAELLDAMDLRLVDRMKHEHDEYVAGRTSAPPVINVLALTGGGDYGAFGAGFLNGWASVTDPAFVRPDFDVVTGVSTGSLIAPFAYVGTDKAYERIETLYRNPKSDWFTPRWFISILFGSSSLVTVDGLKKSLDEAVDIELVRQMAERAKAGHCLAVNATNVDLGVPTIFDVGQESIAAADANNPEMVTTTLLASTAIPVVCPPVKINGCLYADGGVTKNVLMRLNIRDPKGFISTWRRRYPDTPLPMVRYWVIFNNQTETPPETVLPGVLDLAGRNLSISIVSSTLAEIRVIAAEVDDLNDSGVGKGEIFMVAIPNAWRPPVQGQFQKPTMDSLADIGRKMGADPKSWEMLNARTILR